jgi:hypothetical protein
LEDIYEPCSCGSGKKFKFCCYQKSREFNQLPASTILQRATDFKIHECLVREDWKTDGLAATLIVRQLPNLKYLFGFFLVDTYCLGVKDVYVEANASSGAVENIKRRFPENMVPITYQEARSLILGAVEYAKGIGFEPHPDFEKAKYIIESEKSFIHLFDFGKDGKPLYMSGPNDNPQEILATLSRHSGGSRRFQFEKPGLVLGP